MALKQISIGNETQVNEMHFPLWKRSFDVFVSSLGLLILAPFFLLIAAIIKLDSSGPVFFRQERIGYGFDKFRIYKFRTMVADAPKRGSLLTAYNDDRITKVGKILRKVKFDELPQLINVLFGEMTLVGPRPEVEKYVRLYTPDYREILRIRPGITDIASLKYRNESEMLRLAANAEEEYITRVLPDKIALAKEYVRRSSLLFDISLILKTAAKTVAG
jgi:lipopolysaccharide/colanic/teichoic acid biosynthesis glycosyltransferase